MSATDPSGRLASLDQFRGYTVAGMLLVNFVGSFALVPDILKHHNSYCSYADTIMPQFFLAVGFAYRLTALKRLERDGLGGFGRRMTRRILGLLVIAVVVHGLDWPHRVPRGDWPAFARAWAEEPGRTLLDVIRRDYFQTLTHIAVTMLWTLPVIALGVRIRLAWLVGSLALHGWLSHAWYHAWVNADPRGIDGGVLGFLTWTAPVLVGSFAHDLLCFGERGVSTPRGRLAERVQPPGIAEREEGKVPGVDRDGSRPESAGDTSVSPNGRGALLALAGIAIALMLMGYALASIGPTLAVRAGDAEASAPAERPRGVTETRRTNPAPADPSKLAGSPLAAAYRVVEVAGVRIGLDWPPFVKPPEPSPRTMWAMSQRSGSASYLLFASGFGLLIFAAFVVVADRLGLEFGLFRTLGGNALAAYVVHGLINDRIKTLAPRDSPSWYLWTAFALFFVATWLAIRWLERNRLHLRL